MHFELKRTILESGLKQVYLAKKVGIDPTLLSKKIHGYYPITEIERIRLAEILNRRPDELFPGN